MPGLLDTEVAALAAVFGCAPGVVAEQIVVWAYNQPGDAQ